MSAFNHSHDPFRAPTCVQLPSRGLNGDNFTLQVELCCSRHVGLSELVASCFSCLSQHLQRTCVAPGLISPSFLMIRGRLHEVSVPASLLNPWRVVGWFIYLFGRLLARALLHWRHWRVRAVLMRLPNAIAIRIHHDRPNLGRCDMILACHSNETDCDIMRAITE